MRKLASIQQVTGKSPIEGADKIEILSILGWQVISQKENFQIGDKCVYIEVDAVLPPAEWSDFLADRKYKVKTIKLRGQISQGLALPLEILPEELQNAEIGTDVSSPLGITKFDPEAVTRKGCTPKGNFPSFISKTDVERLQSSLDHLQKNFFELLYVTEKLDGTSFTAYYHEGKFGVCSRNLELEDTEDNLYWNIACKYNLEEICKDRNLHSFAFQGEIVGPGIQKNPLKLEEPQLFLFDIFKIRNYEYLTPQTFLHFADELGLPTVPFIEVIHFRPWHDLDYWLELSNKPSLLNYGASQAEGIVVAVENNSRDRFKVINPEYLLKHDR